jgi:cell wall-associated NlpC family hydrolase
MNINPAEKYAETPMEVAAKKEAPALGRIEPGARVAEEAPARRRDVQQAPEYKSLDMKYSYEKPTPPVPQEQQAAAAPKEQAAPLMAKDEADNESQPASPRAKAAAPTRSPEQAGASIGRSAETEAKTRPQAYRERTYREFATSITAFPYKAPAEKRERLLRNYAKLMIGMTKEEIAKLLGDPDHSDMLQTKEPPFEQLGSEWRYYVFLNRPDSVNKKNDQSISVYFSLDGRAHWIVPLNLEGLSAKGSPWRDK